MSKINENRDKNNYPCPQTSFFSDIFLNHIMKFHVIYGMQYTSTFEAFFIDLCLSEIG